MGAQANPTFFVCSSLCPCAHAPKRTCGLVRLYMLATHLNWQPSSHHSHRNTIKACNKAPMAPHMQGICASQLNMSSTHNTMIASRSLILSCSRLTQGKNCDCRAAHRHSPGPVITFLVLSLAGLPAPYQLWQYWPPEPLTRFHPPDLSLQGSGKYARGLSNQAAHQHSLVC